MAAGGEEGFQIYFSDVLGATSPVRHIIYISIYIYICRIVFSVERVLIPNALQ